MDRNRDLRRANISTVDGFPRRRQRVSTLRDSTDEDRQMELQEIVRSRDREQLQKKDRDRDFPKRRRVENRSVVQQRSGGGGGVSYRENVSTNSVDKEYIEEEEETRIHQRNRTNQFSPQSSLSNNSRGLRTFRSSPVLGTSVEEVLGVPIPRRARSASAKKLHEYQNSGNGKSGKDLSNRKISPSPATASLFASGESSPSSSGASLKNKMKYASKSNPSSTIQNDIEIEVAEALFDLMKQSHSQSRSSEREEKVERHSTNTNDGAERGEDEKDPIVKVNAKTILADSMKDLNKGERTEKEIFPAKRKVGSPKESESPSCVKVNVCDIRDSTVTKPGDRDYASGVVEAKEGRIEIDLMALPFLPSSCERDALLAIDPKVMIQDVQKKSEIVSKDEIRLSVEKIGVTRDTQVPNLYLEKHRYDISSVVESTTATQQPSGQKEPKIQSPNSSFSFPIGMGSWHGLLPHTGYMPCPVDESTRFSMTVQPPPFKFSQPRCKRCTTHQYIAHNIHNHQQHAEKSLLSGPSDAATLYGTKPSNFKSVLPEQRFITGNPLLGDFEGGRNSVITHSGGGKDKSSESAADFNARTSGSKSELQQGPNQSTALNFLQNPCFTFPLGHYQPTTMAPANCSGPPQSSARNNVSLPSNSNLSRKFSAKNSSFPGAVTSNNSIFPSDEAAASYMAILQSSGCPFPIPTNTNLPSFKGSSSSSMPFLNSSFYSASLFNISPNQHLLSLPSQKSQLSTGTKISGNKIGASVGGDGSESHSVKPNNNDIPQPFPLSLSLNASSAPLVSLWTQNPSIFQILPEMPLNGGKTLRTSEGKSQTRSGQSPSSAVAPSKFDSSFLPPSLNSVPIPNFYHNQHQMQQIQIKASDYASLIPKWDNFPRATTAPPQGSSQTPVHSIPQVKNSQAQNMLSYNSSISKSTSNSQRNASIVVSKGASTVPVLANCL
ncbi:hypothetical protein OROMI_015808 [Orobanche minor]